MLSQRGWSVLVLFLAVAYALWTLWYAPGWTVDDAYILFRYARNWLMTGIPTWNPGEPAVEGYTGTLYLGLLTAGHALGVPLQTLAKLLGIISYGAAAAFMALLLRELGVRPLFRAVTVLLYFTAAFLFPHALSGLETMVWTALLSAAVWLTVRLLHAEQVRPVGAGATFSVLLATALVRPEGVLFALALSLALFLHPAERGIQLQLSPNLILAWVLVFGLPLAAVNLWRWQLYGELLPNTYFAKQASGFGWGALVSFLEFALQYWALPALLALVVGTGEWERWTELLREHYRRLALLGLVLLGSCCVLLLEYSRSLLQMNYAHRFWVMLYPIGLCLAAAAAEQGFRALEATIRERPLRFRRIRQLAIGFLVLQLAVHGGLWRWNERKFLRDYRQLLQEEHAAAAAFLRQHLPPTSWIVVYPDAGLIPFITGFRTLDGGRLNDRFLARHHWSGTPQDSLILSYFFARSPAAFVFKSRREDRLVLNAEAQALVQDPRFTPYVLAASFRTRARRFAENYFLLVYMHRRFLPQAGLTQERPPEATAGDIPQDVQP